MGIYSSMQRNKKCFAANQLHDAAKRLYNFAANRLHYAAKQLIAKRPDTIQEYIYRGRRGGGAGAFKK